MLINPDVYNDTEIITINNIGIFPNPVTDKLFLTGNTNRVHEIEVYNLSGMKVKTEIFNGESIDVENLEPGYYFLKTNEGLIFKFVKQ